MEDISPRSCRDLECHERHGEISTISARSRQPQRVLGNLGEMEDISPRSHRDLESNKHHSEISARSLQSRRDLLNLDEIISARSRQSRRDLGKNFAWDWVSAQSFKISCSSGNGFWLVYEDLLINFGRTNFLQNRDMACKLGCGLLLSPQLLHGKCAHTVFMHELLAYQGTNEWA